MLTDDDLSRRLGDVFHGAAADLRYSGPMPTAHRRPSAGWIALPAVAAAAGLVAVAGPVLDRSPTPVPMTVPQAGPAATTAAPAVETRTITVAGYTLTYKAEVGAPDPRRGDLDPGRVPAGQGAARLSRMGR